MGWALGGNACYAAFVNDNCESASQKYQETQRFLKRGKKYVNAFVNDEAFPSAFLCKSGDSQIFRPHFHYY